MALEPGFHSEHSHPYINDVYQSCKEKQRRRTRRVFTLVVLLSVVSFLFGSYIGWHLF